MLRKLTPFLTTFLAMLLDTAVIPVLYHGTYTVPLTLAVVLCNALLLGRLPGLLFGMIGGLLIDITAGTLGVMTFFFMAVGFLSALIVDENADRQITGIRFHLRRGGVAFLLYAVGETVFVVYRYFITAAFEWRYVQYISIRALIFAAIIILICPALNRMYFGRGAAQHRAPGGRREARHF